MRSLHIKRAVAFLLLFALLIGVMPVSAYADDTDYAVETVVTEVNETAEATKEPLAEIPESPTTQEETQEQTETAEAATAEDLTPEDLVPSETASVETSRQDEEDSASVPDQNEPDAEISNTAIQESEEIQEDPAETDLRETVDAPVSTDEATKPEETVKEDDDPKSAVVPGLYTLVNGTLVPYVKGQKENETRAAIPNTLRYVDVFGAHGSDMNGNNIKAGGAYTATTYGAGDTAWFPAANYSGSKELSYDGTHYVYPGVMFCNYGPFRYACNDMFGAYTYLALPIRPSQEDGATYPEYVFENTVSGTGVPKYKRENLKTKQLPQYTESEFTQIALVYGVANGMGAMKYSSSDQKLTAAGYTLIMNIVCGYIGLGSDGYFHGTPILTNDTEVNTKCAEILVRCEVYTKEKGLTGSMTGDNTLNKIKAKYNYTPTNMTGYSVASGTATYSNIRYVRIDKSQSSGNQVYIWNPIPINFEKTKGFTLKKTANVTTAEWNCIKDNPMYTLKGAVYEIHQGSDSGPVVETLTTNANGEATSTKKYPVDTVLYAKEKTAPSGYLKDETAHKLVINADESKNVFKVSDKPTFDPATLELKKENANGVYIKGAVFQVQYYASTWAEDSKLMRTWYFESDSDGYVMFDSNHIASGYTSDALYNPYGSGAEFPIGCVVVREIKAATGYVLPTGNDARVFMFITQGGAKTPVAGDPAKYYWGDGHADPLPNGTAYGIYTLTNADDGTGGSMVAENQSAASIGTTAKFADGSKKTEPIGNITIVDTVTYQNFVKNQKYVMVGKLMKKDGTEFKVNNKTVTAQKEFTATAENGSVDMTLTFKAYAGMPTDLVVYEYCYINSVSDGNLVTSHEDKNDDGQTVHFTSPSLETLAYETKTTSRYVDVASSMTIVDRVTYTDLIPGHTYVVVGTLMLRDGNNESQLLVNGQPVTVEKTFTPTKANDKLWVQVSLDTTGLKGKTVVFYERCYLNSVSEANLLAQHTDITDENQSIKFSNPTVETSATNHDTTGREFSPLETVTLDDVVTYKGVIPENEYHVSGILMDKATGEPVKVNGKTITGTADFTAAAANGTVTVTYTFNASLVRGKTLVVFETLCAADGTTILAEHKNLNDAKQTVTVVDPSVSTLAYNKDVIGKVKEIDPAGIVTVRDEVSCNNLIVNTTYKLSGVLMDKNTGEEVKVNGKAVVSEYTFKASAKNSVETIDFTFDATGLNGHDLVVFETLTQQGQEMASHKDINSEAQTVHVNNPAIGTQAVFADDDSKIYDSLSKVEIKDTVNYEGLVAGSTYVMVGTIMVRTEGEDGNVASAPLTQNGNPVTVHKEFNPTAANGTVDLVFEIDASNLKGKTLVVFEELYTKADYEAGNDAITEHKDINDEGQTVKIGEIKIGTTATSAIGGKTISPAPDQTIIDRVSYTGLTVGKTYKVSGVLMRRLENGDAEVLKVNGKTITATKTFVAETADGFVDLSFTLDATGMEEFIIVVYEKMYRIKDDTEYPVADHEDINDDAQAVSTPRPEIHTTAKNKEDGSKLFDPLEEVTLTDTVAYKNLVPGTKYVLKGKLVGKKNDDNGDAVEFEISSNGEPITASTTFTAEAADGEIDIDFTFCGLDMKGYEVVVYECLYIEGNETALVKHEDINDENQTVQFTDIIIETEANSEDDMPVVDPLDEVTIIDTVFYKGLIPGKEYTINGVLMVKSTEMPLIDNGKAVTSSVTFVPEESDGSIDIPFTFNASALRGDAVVVFEALYRENIELATHSDIEDDDQTIKVPNPSVGTTASNLDDGEKIVDPLTVISLEDVVEYKDLIPGHEYTIKGILMERVEDEEGNITETVFLADNEPVTAELTFVPETADGSVSLVFTFTGLNLHGNVIVAYESLYSTAQPEKPIAEHKDINDEGQTVEVTDIIIGTEARIGEDDGKIADPLEYVTVIDNVTYSGLIVGKTYTITGVLMVKSTGMPLLDAEGNAVMASVEFVAETSDGSIELTFEFDARLLRGEELVAFETLSREDVDLATHADLEDEAQTVEIANPIIHTTATDENGAKIYEIGEEVTIYDVVTYENLIPGHRYMLIGFVMDADTEEVLMIDGEPVGQIADFVPEEANGEYLMTFTFSGLDLRGKKLVVFETLLRVTEENEEGEIETVEHIYDHHDIEDLAQTVYFTNPEIGTTATNKEDGSHVAEPIETVTIVDRVEYKDLIPGKTYTVNGILYEKVVDEDGNVTEVELKINGESITATAEFTAEEAEGYVDLEFTFSGLDMAGRTVVAFETLYCGDLELAVHADINDENQTVTFTNPKISTKATVNGGKKAEVAKSVTLIDTVSYKGLVPGKEYTLKGILMDKETGKPLLVNGKEVTAEAKFVPTTEDGTAEMKFVFDASDLKDKEVVVFEEVYRAETLIAEHKDIEDKDQTVSFYKTYSPPTGDETNLPLWIALAALSAAALLTLGAVTIIKLRKKENEI